MPYETNWTVLVLASVCRDDQNGWWSGILTGKFARSQVSNIEKREEYCWETMDLSRVFHVPTCLMKEVLNAILFWTLFIRLFLWKNQGHVCLVFWILKRMSPSGAKRRFPYRPLWKTWVSWVWSSSVVTQTYCLSVPMDYSWGLPAGQPMQTGNTCSGCHE